MKMPNSPQNDESKPGTMDEGESGSQKGNVAGLPEGDDTNNNITSIGIAGQGFGINKSPTLGVSGKLGMTMQQFEMEDENSIDYDADDVQNYSTKAGRDRKNMKRKKIPDWRDDHNFFQALLKRKLRSNDYRTLIWFTIVHVLVIILFFFELFTVEGHEDPMISTTLLHFVWCSMAMMGKVFGMKKMSYPEVILLVLAYVLIYCVGTFYFLSIYDMELLRTNESKLTPEEIIKKA